MIRNCRINKVELKIIGHCNLNASKDIIDYLKSKYYVTVANLF